MSEGDVVPQRCKYVYTTYVRILLRVAGRRHRGSGRLMAQQSNGRCRSKVMDTARSAGRMAPAPADDRPTSAIPAWQHFAASMIVVMWKVL